MKYLELIFKIFISARLSKILKHTNASQNYFYEMKTINSFSGVPTFVKTYGKNLIRTIRLPQVC